MITLFLSDVALITSNFFFFFFFNDTATTEIYTLSLHDALPIGGMVIAVLIGLPAGIVSGLHQGTARDRLVTVGSSVAVAIPDFWLAMILIIVFAVKLGWLPALGYTPFTQSPAEWFQDLLLPWLALGIGGSAVIARQVRGALIDTLDQDYMRTAVAKGLSPSMVVGKHALKNALSPAVTVIGIQ